MGRILLVGYAEGPMLIESNGASFPSDPNPDDSHLSKHPDRRDLNKKDQSRGKKEDEELSAPLTARDLKSSYIEVAPGAGPASAVIASHLSKRGGLLVASLDTGSSGNATAYLGMRPDGSGEMLAVDSGLSRTKFREGLAALGLHHTSTAVGIEQLRELRLGQKVVWFEHLLVTHLHSDHFTESTAKFCKEAGITVHVDPAAVEALRGRKTESQTADKLCAALDQLKAASLLAPFPPGTSKQIGSWIVHAASAMHDVPTNSYSMSFGSLTAFHSGDTGSYTPMMRSLAERAHLMLGDGNYDIQLIDAVDRTPAVNERTKGPLGHMGNHQNAEILRGISKGAHSANLQAIMLLHRSSLSNHQDPALITSTLRECWDSNSAGRCAPTIRVAERGPRVLCALSEDRILILPHTSSSDGFLPMQFGETGLSDLHGRDVMPELLQEMRPRAAALERLISAKDLRERSRDENALIQWRVPSTVALVHTSAPERVKSIAPVVISRESSNGTVRITINAAELRTPTTLQQLCRSLTQVLAPRHPERRGRLFFVDHTGTVVSSVGLPPVSLEDVAKLTELALYEGVTHCGSQSEATKVQWSSGGKLALLVTDDVLFERQGLADVVALYNQERKRLYIETFAKRPTQEYLDTDRAMALINRLDLFVRSLPADKKSGDISWALRTTNEGRGTLKHSGTLELSAHQLLVIRDLIEQYLLWG